MKKNGKRADLKPVLGTMLWIHTESLPLTCTWLAHEFHELHQPLLPLSEPQHQIGEFHENFMK